MQREFVYTKQGLQDVLEHMLEHDVIGNERYAPNEMAEQAFEKRAVLEFLLWFSDHAFPGDFRFKCEFEHLDEDYPSEYARIIAEGRGWSNRRSPDARRPPTSSDERCGELVSFERPVTAS